MASLLSVAEAKARREEARLGAQEKGTEVHVLLGERYHQLVESADAIRELASSASRASGFVSRVEDRVAAFEEGPAAGAAAPAAAGGCGAGPSRDDAAARIVATAPVVWRALDRDDHGAAAGHYVQCRAWIEGLEGGSARASLAPYVAHLRARVAASAERFLCAYPGDGGGEEDGDGDAVAGTRRYADALAALAILGADPSGAGALATFVASRTSWLARAGKG